MLRDLEDVIGMRVVAEPLLVERAHHLGLAQRDLVAEVELDGHVERVVGLVALVVESVTEGVGELEVPGGLRVLADGLSAPDRP